MRNEKITPLYERLSRDDELQGESNSISHQSNDSFVNDEQRVQGNSQAWCEAGEKTESGADVPLRPAPRLSWRPGDLKQHKGRIVRQSN